MREELIAAIDLYEGMPEEARPHWRERSVPSIKFEDDDEKRAFFEDLDRIDRGDDPLYGED